MSAYALLQKVAVVAAEVAVLYGLSRMLFFWVLQATAARKRGGGRLIKLLRLPGNLVHEIGHATGYLLFGYRVKRLVPCTRDPAGMGICTPGKAWSPLAVPWVATGAAAVFPLVFGTLVLRGLVVVMDIPFINGVSGPEQPAVLYLWDSVRETLIALGGHDWRKYLFLYFGFSIGAELAPSSTDVRRGLIPLLAIAGMLAALTLWLGSVHADAPIWAWYSQCVAAALAWLSPLFVFGVIATALVAVVTVPGAILLRALRRVLCV